ncbi:YoaK family protein [Danxiaibacter flavus]|uniref:YoaK family protein n=1 Tax=Danxiaibacter flavus TaxID=3049108 RepID=A0ABV3ZJ45_9BACT|nr:YoaK family protein [Chitinophagaceae bacterium DXS]
MLRHAGPKRSYKHNIKLASLLGLTAGFVNSASFLSFAVLTTNVTGHAALFAEQVYFQHWDVAKMIALWMLLFLAGAFTSSFLISLMGRNRRFSYAIPILLECSILALVAGFGHRYTASTFSKAWFAGSLLFAMGLQNALVTMISGAVVRTTHLTGTFTDLGIELAQLYKHYDNTALHKKIKLHAGIILFFLAGAMLGVSAYSYLSFHAFYLPVMLLFIGLSYDVFRTTVKASYRKWKRRKDVYVANNTGVEKEITL